MTDLQTITSLARYLLSFELLLGGQCRITDRLTPSLTRRAYAKADGYRRYLPIIPSRNAKEHIQVTGVLMFASGAMLLLPRSMAAIDVGHMDATDVVRAVGKGLALVLPCMGIWSQWRMGVPYRLPVVNAGLAIVIIYGDSKL